MTAEDFRRVETELGITRAALCAKIGIAPNSATAYALGRKPIPLTVALACAAVVAGLQPYGTTPTRV